MSVTLWVISVCLPHSLSSDETDQGQEVWDSYRWSVSPVLCPFVFKIKILFANQHWYTYVPMGRFLEGHWHPGTRWDRCAYSVLKAQVMAMLPIGLNSPTCLGLLQGSFQIPFLPFWRKKSSQQQEPLPFQDPKTIIWAHAECFSLLQRNCKVCLQMWRSKKIKLSGLPQIKGKTCKPNNWLFSPSFCFLASLEVSLDEAIFSTALTVKRTWSSLKWIGTVKAEATQSPTTTIGAPVHTFLFSVYLGISQTNPPILAACKLESIICKKSFKCYY